MKAFIVAAAIVVAGGLGFVFWLLEAYARMCGPVVDHEEREAT